MRWVDEAIDEVKDRHEDEHPPDCEVTECGDERDDEDADGVDELGAGGCGGVSSGRRAAR